MSATATNLADYLARESAGLAERCTACGKCVEVCPVVPYIDVHRETSENIVHVIRDVLGARTSVSASGVASSRPARRASDADRSIEPLSPGASAWAQACNGCGECIPACPEAINPRRMLVLANVLLAAGERRTPERCTPRRRTPELFRKMSRAIRVMAGLQLVPREYLKVLRQPAPRSVPVIFYLGCNPIRTPHLLLNAMEVLDAIGVDYEVLGGPGVCCGIIHAKWQGEIGTADRVTSGTVARFETFAAERVLTWCPSCQVHLGESLAGFRPMAFDLEHVTDFLAAQAETLRAKFVRPVPRRVVLHAHVGLAGLGRNVESLLAAIPGLVLADTVWESGYACGGSGCNRVPALQALEHARLLDRARDANAEVLVTLYHGCHTAFVPAEKDARFRVLNFTDLLVEALGRTPHDDVFKRFRLQDDVRLVIEEGLPYLRANGIDLAPDVIERALPELLTLAEFRGGLDCFRSGG